MQYTQIQLVSLVSDTDECISYYIGREHNLRSPHSCFLIVPYLYAGGQALSGCKNIRKLKLGFSIGLTSAGLACIGRGCARLENLDVYRCKTYMQMHVD